MSNSVDGCMGLGSEQEKAELALKEIQGRLQVLHPLDRKSVIEVLEESLRKLRGELDAENLGKAA